MLRIVQREMVENEGRNSLTTHYQCYQLLCFSQANLTTCQAKPRNLLSTNSNVSCSWFYVVSALWSQQWKWCKGVKFWEVREQKKIISYRQLGLSTFITLAVFQRHWLAGISACCCRQVRRESFLSLHPLRIACLTAERFPDSRYNPWRETPASGSQPTLSTWGVVNHTLAVLTSLRWWQRKPRWVNTSVLGSWSWVRSHSGCSHILIAVTKDLADMHVSKTAGSGIAGWVTCYGL